jgi:hypothetical protein
MDIKAGDVIGASGDGGISFIVNILSYGVPWVSISHVGIMGDHEGELLLFEATTLSNIPCVIQGKMVEGMQAVRLKDRVEQYDGKMFHYPLADPLFASGKQRLSQFLHDQIGKEYDLLGALRAGGKVFAWLEAQLREEDLNFLFCSELVAASLNRVDRLETDSASRWNPNQLIRHGRKKKILHKPRRLTCTDFSSS